MDTEKLAGMLATLADEIEAEQEAHPHGPVDIDLIAVEMDYTLPELCEALREASAALTSECTMAAEAEQARAMRKAKERAKLPTSTGRMQITPQCAAYIPDRAARAEGKRGWTLYTTDTKSLRLHSVRGESWARGWNGYAYRLEVDGQPEAEALYLYAEGRMLVAEDGSEGLYWTVADSPERGADWWANDRSQYEQAPSAAEEVQASRASQGEAQALAPAKSDPAMDALESGLPLVTFRAAWLYQEVALAELAGTALEDVARDYGGHAYRLWVSGDEANARHALYLPDQRRMGITSLALATEVRWATCESAEAGIGLYAHHREQFTADN